MPNTRWVRFTVIMFALGWMPWIYLFMAGEFLDPINGGMISFASYLFYEALAIMAITWWLISIRQKTPLPAIVKIAMACCLLLSSTSLPNLAMDMRASRTLTLLMLASSVAGFAGTLGVLGAYGFFDQFIAAAQAKFPRKEKTS